MGIISDYSKKNDDKQQQQEARQIIKSVSIMKYGIDSPVFTAEAYDNSTVGQVIDKISSDGILEAFTRQNRPIRRSWVVNRLNDLSAESLDYALEVGVTQDDIQKFLKQAVRFPGSKRWVTPFWDQSEGSMFLNLMSLVISLISIVCAAIFWNPVPLVIGTILLASPMIPAVRHLFFKSRFRKLAVKMRKSYAGYDAISLDKFKKLNWKEFRNKVIKEAEEEQKTREVANSFELERVFEHLKDHELSDKNTTIVDQVANSQISEVTHILAQKSKQHSN